MYFGKLDKSSLLLIISNCIPLLGVLFFGWNVFETVFLYWVESAIIALATVALLVLMPILPADREGVPVNQKFIAIPFFIAHFGGFMAAHLFAIVFFLEGADWQRAFGILQNASGLQWAIISLCISHGYSFVTNYIINNKYKQPLTKDNFWIIMTRPYKRIFLMQFTVLLGAFAIVLLGLPQLMVVIFIAIKTFVDLKAHTKEHERDAV